MDLSVAGLSVAALDCATASDTTGRALLGHCSCFILGKVCRTLLFPICRVGMEDSWHVGGLRFK